MAGQVQVQRFKGDLRRFQELLERRAAAAAAALGALARFDVAINTPFDTGRAAGSWNASLNGPNTRVLPDEVQFPNVESAAKVGETNLQGIRLGDSIHISNSLPYIRRLNAGSSTQAPANFVEMAVQNTIARSRGNVLSKTIGSIR